MPIDRRITNGLAWAGALVVVAIPAADAALRQFGPAPVPRVAVVEAGPNVEIRVSDVCVDVDDAVLVGLLARALVATEAAAWRNGAERPSWRVDELKAASWRAARYGLPGPLVHPVEMRLAPTREVVDSLVDHVRPALEEAGDDSLVADLFEQLVARGNGAVRSRAVHEATGSLERVVADLADRTEASWQG